MQPDYNLSVALFNAMPKDTPDAGVAGFAFSVIAGYVAGKCFDKSIEALEPDEIESKTFEMVSAGDH